MGERKGREGRAHSLLLRSPSGEEVAVDARSRPRAYLAAEASVVSGRPPAAASAT